MFKIVIGCLVASLFLVLGIILIGGTVIAAFEGKIDSTGITPNLISGSFATLFGIAIVIITYFGYKGEK